MIKKSMGITKGVWEWQKGCGNVCGFGNGRVDAGMFIALGMTVKVRE
jgi:hypothetical protein